MKKTFFISIIFLLCNMLNAQDKILTRNLFFYPQTTIQNKTIQAIGISSAKLPEDVIETDDVFRAPLFSYHIKYGLPHNFIAEAGVETNVVTFLISVGSKWNYSINDWGFSIGNDFTYWFGKLEQFGFDTKVKGLILKPNIVAGYKFEKFVLSLKSEFLFNIAEKSENGELDIYNDLEFFNGITVGVYLEQPLWKDNYVVIGLRSTYLNYYYPMWAAFSTFDRKYFIPEISFMFIL